MRANSLSGTGLETSRPSSSAAEMKPSHQTGGVAAPSLAPHPREEPEVKQLGWGFQRSLDRPSEGWGPNPRSGGMGTALLFFPRPRRGWGCSYGEERMEAGGPSGLHLSAEVNKGPQHSRPPGTTECDPKSNNSLCRCNQSSQDEVSLDLGGP